MARLERTIYRSDATSVVDILVCGAECIRLDAASLGFVRAGYFGLSEDRPEAIVDSNYAVFGGKRALVLAGLSEHICACTIVRCEQCGMRERGGCAPVSSHTFYLCAQLMCAAPNAIGERVLALVSELGMPSECDLVFRHSAVVTEIRRRMNDSLSKRLSLEAAAREFYMSPFTLSRLFHRETGVRLRDYLLRLRLRRAVNFLMYSRKSLTSIALDLGFFDEPHFSKAFRGEFGTSPYSVRKYCTRSDFC